jgi:catechol 2,3-dioxygenase-like lactoylglutathione lyase family enzyme
VEEKMRLTLKTIIFSLVILLSFQANAKLGFVGIGVSNIEKSTKFYQNILGLDIIGTYDDITVDNADGSESFLDEVVLGYNNKPGTLLVLMNWPKDKKKYDGDNVKIVFEVEDAKEVMKKIKKAGGKIDREALPHYTIEGGLVGLGRDLDNYVVEIIQWKIN